jgi:Rieske Fe-S protein
VTRDPSRRTVLLTGAGGAGLAALAACANGGGNPAQTTRHPAGHPLATLASIPVGRAKSVSLPDGSPAFRARPTPTTVVCLSAICTHAGCTVMPNGAQLDCPCHGSVFNALTGAVERTPATQPLSKIPVRVRGGQVFTA